MQASLPHYFIQVCLHHVGQSCTHKGELYATTVNTVMRTPCPPTCLGLIMLNPGDLLPKPACCHVRH